MPNESEYEQRYGYSPAVGPMNRREQVGVSLQQVLPPKQAKEARPETLMEQHHRRLADLERVFASLSIDFHDRLMAAREAFAVSTPPVAGDATAKHPSQGPLGDRLCDMERTAQSMADTVAGFRELFG